MQNEIIKTWIENRGFGFIENKAGKDFFFHITQWQSGPKKPAEGMHVEFTVQQGGKGMEAIGVRLIDPATPKAPATASSTHSLSSTGTDSNSPNPYHFVQLSIQNAITDTPVWHDGRNSAELLCGEIQLSLTALTPLLVGQWQYTAEQLKEAAEEDVTIVSNCRSRTVEGRKLPFFNTAVEKEKAILEPLRLRDGRVMLPGTSLKGMVRHSLGALLSAPMERVAERSYSYRPNAKFQPDESFRKVRPAIIESANGHGVKIRILPKAKSVWFGHKKDLGSPKYDKNAKTWIGIVKVSSDKNKRFKKKDANGECLGACYFAHYDGGIDGKGILSKAAKKGGTYDAVLVPEDDYDKGLVNKELPELVIDFYLKTLQHLQDDDGLLASSYPNGDAHDHKLARKKIEEIENLWKKDRKSLVGRLIYVELEDNKRITSMGHHYYYRWRYANTIRTIWRPNGAPPSVRSILKPLPCETETEENRPKLLTAARLLFGFTSYDEKDPLKQDGSANIGQKDWQRLAGRIQINSALECLKDNNTGSDNERFLKGDEALALQSQGQPQPSALENYLMQPQSDKVLQIHRQDGGQMLTYGDLPGRDTAAPRLAGRKFDLHQPDAAKDENCYKAQQDDHIVSKQGRLVRFVSKPGTTFRFSLRFKDLRDWELGALLTILEPEKHLSSVLTGLNTLKPQFNEKLSPLLDRIESFQRSDKKSKKPLFAHKFGNAKSLGFGSALIQCDSIKLLQTDETGLPEFHDMEDDTQRKALKAFTDKWARHLHSVDYIEQWCAVHQYTGRTRAAFPKKQGEIFKYHSEARANHIAARRLRKKKGELSNAILEPLVFDP